ncbi:unnamed protein product [Arabis nemorensis]|uniref:Uncharacterized protein n=1 Tax=Arabis nemorensis TaxID=586526 RepID=A0A565CC55_9BRAS|nr:unnamed protein product [Arabis nemorensis]
MVHEADVARAVYAQNEKWEKVRKERPRPEGIRQWTTVEMKRRSEGAAMSKVSGIGLQGSRAEVINQSGPVTGPVTTEEGEGLQVMTTVDGSRLCKA